jgi:putative ABC transport system permease protein
MHDHDHRKELFSRPHLWLIALAGVIVPRRLRADWRQEWEAELRSREALLADWDRLDWRNKFELLWRSLGAFRDALLLQPRRLEDKMFQDFRFGVRMLLKQPAFTLIAALTLSLGIGATSAVFSLIQGVLLTPPPYERPEQIALITTARTDGQQTSRPRGWPAAQWLEWQKEAKSFEAIAAYRWEFSFIVSENGSESVEGMIVTKDYFSVTGLKPYLGRAFQDSDAVVDAPQVIILGYDLWRRRFNGDPNIIGKTIPFRGLFGAPPPTVIGVMPPSVRFLPSPNIAGDPNYNVNAQVEWWLPARLIPAILKFPMWNVAGRLQSGATLATAQAELASITARQAQADRDFAVVTVRTQSLTAEMNRDGRRILLPLLGAAALVLLIACGNVAALLLVRGLQRQQEYAVRCALGAGRVALFRQVSTESLLLALLGGALGVGLAFGVVKLFKLIGGHAIPRLDAVTTGWPVLVCGLGAAAIAALLAGFLPALRAARLDPMIALKDAGPKSSAGRGERRLLRAVTMIQTALTLALLVGAGLLIRTMNNLSKVQAGYNTGKILTISVTAMQRDVRERLSFDQQALERVSRLPGVQHAAFGWGVPLTGNSSPWVVEIEGRPPASKPSDMPVFPGRAVTEGYFKLLGQPLVAGRDFRSTDNRDAPRVTIINQAFASRYFLQADPIGKKLWSFGRRDQQIEIIGVVANGRTDDLTRAAEPEIYTSQWQFPAFFKHLLVRTEADPLALMAGVQRELRAIDPTVSIENLKTLEEIRGDSLASRSFAMRLLIGFSIVASALTLVGIYGVLSLSVAARRRELAIRTAMGAGRRDLLKLVLGEGLRLVAGGVAAGLAAAIVLSRVLRSFLFEVEPTDPVTLIVVGLLFVAVALLACWSPARRAAKVDPLEALRYE